MTPSLKRILVLLLLLAGGLLSTQLFFRPEHYYLAWERWFGFYGAFGFVSCAALVFLAKLVLRPLVQVKYEEEGP